MGYIISNFQFYKIICDLQTDKLNVFTLDFEYGSTINNIPRNACQVLFAVECFCNGVMSGYWVKSGVVWR